MQLGSKDEGSDQSEQALDMHTCTFRDQRCSDRGHDLANLKAGARDVAD